MEKYLFISDLELEKFSFNQKKAHVIIFVLLLKIIIYLIFFLYHEIYTA